MNKYVEDISLFSLLFICSSMLSLALSRSLVVLRRILIHPILDQKDQFCSVLSDALQGEISFIVLNQIVSLIRSISLISRTKTSQSQTSNLSRGKTNVLQRIDRTAPLVRLARMPDGQRTSSIHVWDESPYFCSYRSKLSTILPFT